MRWMSRLLVLSVLVGCGGTHDEPVPLGLEDDKTEQDGDGPIVQRQLIQTARVSTTVPVWSNFDENLDLWLGTHGGHVADASYTHDNATVEYASMRLRVPGSALDAFLSWTDETTGVRSMSVQSEDVTADWVDIGARLDAAEQTEQRLNTLLDGRSAKLQDILDGERELARVRAHIESLQAKQRLLGDRIAMATVYLDVFVDQDPIIAATFLDDAGRTWGGSLSALATTVRWAALVAVAITPWALGLMLTGGLLWLLVPLRRLTRSNG